MRSFILLFFLLGVVVPQYLYSQTNWALSFDGSDDYVDLGSSSDLKPVNQLTVELWACRPVWNDSKNVILISNSEYGGYEIEANFYSGWIGGWIYVNDSWCDVYYEFASSFSDDSWHHIALTYDGKDAKLYVDGQLKDTNTKGTYGISYSYTNSTLIGAEAYQANTPESGYNYFDGKIDEVRIWNIARTATEISDNMYSDIGTNEYLKAYYKMSDGTGTSLTDNSGNTHTGTLLNGPTWTTHLFKVTSTSPAQNALNVSATATVTVNFNFPLKTSTVTSSSVYAFGEISGLHTGTFEVSSSSFTFTPTAEFKTGERVTVILCATIESSIDQAIGHSYSFEFTIAAQNEGSGIFSPDYTLNLNAGDEPRDFTAADFDKDGDIDFVVSHYESVLRIVKNTDAGYTTSDFSIDYLYEANNIISADFDNDGWMDLAAIVYDGYSDSMQLVIFLNAGDGSFNDAVLYPYTGTCRDILTADFNGDGYVDIAILGDGIDKNLSVKMNDGDGTFGAQADYDFGVYIVCISFTLADFNNDGYIDIVATAFDAYTGDNGFIVAWNDGSGIFTNIHTYLLSNRSRNIIAADFNGDNYMDIALSYYNESKIAVLLNNTSGSFPIPTEISTDNQPVLVNSFDYNADGKMDIVVLSEGYNPIQVLTGVGDGTFSSASNTITKYPGQETFTSDFNNDGILDIAFIESYYDEDAEEDIYNLCVLNGFVPAAEPTVQTSSLTASTTEMTYVTLQWTNGNGEKRIVVATDNAALNDVPDDGVDYSADAEIGFGSGDKKKGGGGGSGRVLIGNGYVQYCGTASTLTITGLIPSHSYTFTIFEYNGTGAATNYITTSPATLEVETAVDRTLDVDFSSDGMATAKYGTQNTSGVSVNLLSGGKIIVGGQVQTEDGNNGNFGIACFNSDGTLDNTFGTNGFTITELPNRTYDCVREILIQNITKGERIIAVGENNSPVNLALACYNTGGSLDNTFGTNGTVIVNPFSASNFHPTCAILQPDGKIVVGGYGQADINIRLILVRFTAAGALDTDFSTDGYAYLDGYTVMSGGYVGIQSDGKLLIAGTTSDGNNIVIARFTSAGILDNTFDTDGVVTADLGDNHAVGLIGVQPSGMIIVAARYTSGASDYIALLRYDADGKLDNTFGTGGVVTTTVTSEGDYLSAGYITAIGKIVLTGYSYTSPETTFVLRYNSDGTLDNTFAEDGITLTYYSAGSWGQGVTVQSDNKIVVTGGYSDGTFVGGAIVYRYDAETTPLPVELISLTASANNNSATLNWITATEVNNYGFEIERRIPLNPPLVKGDAASAEGDWKTLGFVEGNGNSNSPKEYSFTDNEVTAGNYSYRLKQIDIDGSFEYSQSIKVAVGSPTEFSLSQNYPNPFNPVTCIKYSIPGSEYVQLKVYDILGNEVSTIVNDKKEAGNYEVNFNASYLASGVYFYRLTAGAFTSIKKFVLMK